MYIKARRYTVVLIETLTLSFSILILCGKLGAIHTNLAKQGHLLKR